MNDLNKIDVEQTIQSGMPFVLNSLEADEYAEDEELVPQGFTIDNYSKAEWAARKIIEQQRAIKLKTDEAQKMKEDYIAQVNDWLEKEVGEAQRDIDSLSAMLQPFIESELAGKKKRSVNLPSGRAGFRKGTVTFELEGQKVDGKSEQLLSLVKQHQLEDYVVVKESVDWAGLKKSLNVTEDGKVVSSDGELLEAMIAIQEPDKFYVQPLK